jgi:hypothetical protein
MPFRPPNHIIPERDQRFTFMDSTISEGDSYGPSGTSRVFGLRFCRNCHSPKLNCASTRRVSMRGKRGLKSSSAATPFGLIVRRFETCVLQTRQRIPLKQHSSSGVRGAARNTFSCASDVLDCIHHFYNTNQYVTQRFYEISSRSDTDKMSFRCLTALPRCFGSRTRTL